MPNSTDPSPTSNVGSSPIPNSAGATGAASELALAPAHARPSSGRLAAQLLIAAVISAILGGVLVQYFGSPYKIPAGVIRRSPGLTS